MRIAFERLGVALAPDGSPQEAEGVLNPAAVRDRDGHLLLYPRLVAPGNISRVGLVRVHGTGAGARYERAGDLADEHDALLAAIQRGDAPSARALLEAHIRHGFEER